MEVIENMPFAEYAKRPGVNASLLKIVHRKSLLHARAYLDGKFREESDVLDFGKCFHSLALEDEELFAEIPETYTNEKGEVKPWNWNATVCKKWGDDQGESIPLRRGQVESVRTMADVVRRELGEARKGRTELSLFAEMKVSCREQRIPVKCRIDLLPDREVFPIFDLKSCESAEPERFLRSSLDLGYHLQAAFIIDVVKLCGFERDSFALLAVESDAPHAPCCLTFSDEPYSLLRVGRLRYRAALQRLLNAQESGRWDSYGRHAAEDYAPAWLKEELELTA